MSGVKPVGCNVQNSHIQATDYIIKDVKYVCNNTTSASVLIMLILKIMTCELYNHVSKKK